MGDVDVAAQSSVAPASEARCVELAISAAQVEREAMQLDRGSHLAEAAERYREAAELLLQAAAACPSNHPDRVVIQEHAREVLARATYLDEAQGSGALEPLEEHIHSVQLTVGTRPQSLAAMPARATALPRAGERAAAQGDRKVMSAAAVIGGAAGLFLLGPVSAAALGAVAAYATTREDTAGTAARKVGKVGVQVVEKARHLDEEYRITGRAASVGQSALEQAKALDSRYHIWQRAWHVTGRTQQALSSFMDKHRVTDTLGHGLSSASGALSSLVSKAGR